MKFPLALGCVVGAAVIIASQTTYKLVINGKDSKSGPIMVKDKLYVPIDALKAAGLSVTVDKSTVSIKFPKQTAEGGAYQQDGQEGKLGEWLFNGIWRLRVASFTKREDGPGYQAVIEIRNGSKYPGISLAGTGWNGITLALEDGNSVSATSDAVDLRDAGLAQGASFTGTVLFDTESASKPDRIILRLDPKGLAGTNMTYSVANPSFRISVKDLAHSID